MRELDYNHLTVSEATKIQLELKDKIDLSPIQKKVETIAGADISFNKFETAVYAGIVVLSYPDLKPLAKALVQVDVHFPYVSGYLAFREVPALLQAWELLPEKPDVLVIDGHGIAHPRGMGIAAHFGAMTDQATLGCAKTLLYGLITEPSPEAGSYTPMLDKKDKSKIIGWTLRTKNNVKPLFISPGNKMNMDDALQIMKNCLGPYRIPKPTRLAHDTVNLFRTHQLKAGYSLIV